MKHDDVEEHGATAVQPTLRLRKQPAQVLYFLVFLLIVLGVGRGCLRQRGYEYYPKIVKESAHLDRGGASILHSESIYKGTAAWLANNVESKHWPNQMFDIYLKDLMKSGWTLVDKQSDRYTFCKGEIKLELRFYGVSVKQGIGLSLYKYSEEFQWPDWEGYCKGQ